MFLRQGIPSKYELHARYAIAIFPLSDVDNQLLQEIRQGLFKALKRNDLDYIILEKTNPPLESAYNPVRRQYHATKILAWIERVAQELGVFRILGIVDVDLYVPYLNFVFGEARCPGRSALISLYRLRPEVYGQPPNQSIFYERAVKEAVHEIGHTFGLGHCDSFRCVMFFSNSIYDTDNKPPLFCSRCQIKLDKLISWFLQEAKAL